MHGEVDGMNLVGYYAVKGAESLASKALRPYFQRKWAWTRRSRREPDQQLIALALAAHGVEAEPFTIDIDAFRKWVADANYPQFAYVVNREEKFLEHFVSVELLGKTRGGAGDLIVDVASCRSFFPHILRSRGFRVIAQDLTYPLGLHGDHLGGDAAEMDLTPETVSGVTLHCSFEHFERDADTRFVRNIGRLLKPGARAVILPLYLSDEYVVESDPLISRGKVQADAGAALVGSFGYANRFGRHYDVAALLRRVIEPACAAGLNVKLKRITNARDVSPGCYLKHAMVLERPQ